MSDYDWPEEAVHGLSRLLDERPELVEVSIAARHELATGAA